MCPRQEGQLPVGLTQDNIQNLPLPPHQQGLQAATTTNHVKMDEPTPADSPTNNSPLATN